jgi:hypothetical protein
MSSENWHVEMRGYGTSEAKQILEHGLDLRASVAATAPAIMIR